MSPEVRNEGAEKFARLARALREIGDKELRKELYRGINRAIRPLSASVKKSTTSYFPRRYALELKKSLRIETKKRPIRDPAITLGGVAKTQRGKDRNLSALNRGRLRHPLYGNRKHWFNQQVKTGWWDEPLSDGADEVRQELVNVLDDIGRKLERKL